jgi:hypothetical protein
MKYFIENKNKFKTVVSPIFIFLLLSLIFLFYKIDYHLNLFFLLFILIPIPIYTFFTKSFKGYSISFIILFTIFGLIMQTISIYGVLKSTYGHDIFYYFLLFFIIFYLLLIFDFRKANKLAINKSIYLSKLIDEKKVKKDRDYYIDDENFKPSGKKNNQADEEIGLTTFYTFIMATIVAIPIVIFGKLAIAFGIIAARYFPNSNFIIHSAFFMVGTIFFLLGISIFLTYLKYNVPTKKHQTK